MLILMSYAPPPSKGFEHLRLRKVRDRTHRKRWKDSDGKIYEWDGFHCELEVYDQRGRHLGAINPATGEFVKAAKEGRTTET